MLNENILDDDQESIADRLYERDYSIFIAPKGYGKTRTLLVPAQALIDDGELDRVLIVAPKQTLDGWVKEGTRVGIDVVSAGGKMTPEQRGQIINSPNKIVVINPELLKWLCSTWKRLPFEGLILDEITKYADPGSVGVKKLRHKRKHLKWVVGATAHPLMEKPQALYGQCLMVDGGKALGTRYERFLQDYFYQADFQGHQHDLRDGAGERLMAIVAPLCVIADGAAYEASLPDLIEEEVVLEPPAGFWDHYDAMAGAAFLEIGGVEVEAANAAVVSGKLEQVCQGAVYDENKTAHWLHRAKVEAMVAELEDFDEQVVVVYYYTYELAAIQQYFPDAVGLDRKSDFIAGRARVLYMHFKSGSHGVDGLQLASCRMLCLKPIWSADGWDQIAGRLRRRGQQQVVTRTTLIMEGTIDEIILDRLDGKEDTGRTLMEHLGSHAE